MLSTTEIFIVDSISLYTRLCKHTDALTCRLYQLGQTIDRMTTRANHHVREIGLTWELGFPNTPLRYIILIAIFICVAL